MVPIFNSVITKRYFKKDKHLTVEFKNNIKMFESHYEKEISCETSGNFTEH